MTRNTTTDVMTGNLPDDHDYEFCSRYGLMTVAAQQRNSSLLDKRMAQEHEQLWFKNSSAFTGEGD